MKIMRFIEFTDKEGHRVLLSMNQIERIIDRNKTSILVLKEESITLSFEYAGIIRWLEDPSRPPILHAGQVL